MTPVQEKFVARRANLIRVWPVVGMLISLLFIGLYIFAFKQLPIYIDPQTLATKVQGGQLGVEELAHIAIVGGTAFIACGLAILTVFYVITVSLFNEKRLIAIIRAQQAALSSSPAVAEASEPAGNEL